PGTCPDDGTGGVACRPIRPPSCRRQTADHITVRRNGTPCRVTIRFDDKDITGVVATWHSTVSGNGALTHG
ncbi:MAG: hypothetical protein AB7I48_10360, partial [Planctomycetaceae bacterium]